MSLHLSSTWTRFRPFLRTGRLVLLLETAAVRLGGVRLRRTPSLLRHTVNQFRRCRGRRPRRLLPCTLLLPPSTQLRTTASSISLSTPVRPTRGSLGSQRRPMACLLKPTAFQLRSTAALLRFTASPVLHIDHSPTSEAGEESMTRTTIWEFLLRTLTNYTALQQRTYFVMDCRPLPKRPGRPSPAPLPTATSVRSLTRLDGVAATQQQRGPATGGSTRTAAVPME
jgi:hypothetical protein